MTATGPGVRSILGNATYLFGMQAVTTLARGAYVVVLARVLGPEEFGTLNYALAWYLVFISLTYLGLDAHLVQQVATDRASAPRTLRQTLALRSAAALVVAAASWAVAASVDADPGAWRLSAIFSVALIGRAVWIWAVSAFTAFESTHFALRWDAVFRPLEIAAALLVLAYRPELEWLAATHAILWCVQGAVGVRTVTRHLAPLSGALRLRESWQLLTATWPAGVYTIVTSVFMQAPIVIAKLIEPDDARAGQFVLAYQACAYLLVIPYLFSSVLLPVVSRADARGDGKDVRFTGALIRATCLVGGGALVLLGPAVPSLTVALLGNEYSLAGELLRASLWLSIPFACVNFILPLFFARRAYAPVGVHGSVSVAVAFALLSFAAQGDTLVGVLIATGVGITSWLILMVLATRAHVPSFDRARSFAALASVLATLLASLFATRWGTGVQLLISLATLVVTAAVLRAIVPEDLRAMTQTIRAARARAR